MTTEAKNDAAPPTTTVLDLELEPYRDGFSRRAVIGAFFLAAVMVPAAIYLSLMLGSGLGAAADWVTVILFLELARRSFQKLTRQEIMVLLHVASSVGTGVGTAGLAGGVFGQLVWNSYLRNSNVTEPFGLHTMLPDWVAPSGGGRSLWDTAWLPAIGVLVISHILGQTQKFVCGYLAFRITSDLERLPFPMAPLYAQGAMALAEHSGRTESWRWNAFSLGAGIGAAFAVLSTLVPSVTGTLLAQPLFLLPNPWWDISPFFRDVLGMNATAVVITADLGAVLVGMIIPWRVLVGSVVGTVFFQLILNPYVLYPMGVLKHWQPGFNPAQTALNNSLDFYLSLTIGCAVAVAIAGLASLAWGLHKKRLKHRAVTVAVEDGTDAATVAMGSPVVHPPEGRGDFPIWLMIAIFILTSFGYVALCHWLVPDFPVWMFFAFAFLFTPLMTYIHARMVGITGTFVGLPMVREGTFFMSGYEKPDVWFAPIPLHDYGGMAQFFRQMELTRTKFTSMLKAELLILPIMMVASFLFWSYIWSLDPIPSEKYPPVQVFWPVQAKMAALWSTAQSSGSTFLTDAIKWPIIGLFMAVTLMLLGVFGALGLSVEFIYGGIAGANMGIVHVIFPALIGAILSRFVFSRKFGAKQWKSYVPVILAGFACGAGLVGMLGMAIVFLQRSVSSLPY